MTAGDPIDDDAVRRTVTIMFADLVGSTAFAEAVDAESARREMGAYHQLTRAVIERHGGAIIKFQGDGVMAGFGADEVAEDDADRAVRAGLDLQREFQTIIDGIGDRHGVEVNLRVGINTGEVVIADGDDDMIGDPINTAARIEGQCTPGRVLVGEQTWRLTRSSVDYEVLGEVEVKGKAEPIATFQVLAAVEDEEVATPFVGREPELATLTAALEDTIAMGSPQLVTVIGSPGVGKTRLAAELASRASEVTSFDLRVDRAGAATFEPVADLLRAVSELPKGLDREAILSHVDGFVDASVDDRDRLVPLLAAFLGAAPMRSTEESLWAARRLVELVVADQPAVIVLDDIQWAEPLFLDLLEHLVEWTEGAAFIVALARPEIREIRPAFAEIGRRVSEVVALEGLDTATMAELATGILGGKELPAELIARLPESTEGNPLFVRELVRMLVDDGVVTETPTAWVLAIDADAVDVPPTIISLLASRVERMDDDERRVVEAAAVVGSEFPRGAIGALLPNIGAAQLDRVLERLRRQEIIDATGTYRGDEPVWRFHHVLIRDAAYRRLLKERRADMHRRVGQWTEQTAAAVSGDHEISIAFHYEQAHGYLRELGPLDDDARTLGTHAAELLSTAAERAVSRDDLAAAGALATRALAILEPDDQRRPELLLAACEAWFSAGRVRDGVVHLDELRAHTGDERIRAWTDAFEGQYVVLTEPDRLEEIEPSVGRAAERLAELDDDAGVAKARLVRALILARTGRVGRCEDELDAALAAARAADDRRRITAVLAAAPLAALWGPSPVARAGGRCLDIIRLLRITSASPMVEAVSIRCQAVLEAMRGRFDEARDLLGRSQAIVEELGLRHGILECRMFAGYIELLADDAAGAESHLRVAHAGLDTLGVGADAGQAAALLSQALLDLGQVDEAAALADESARLAGQNLQTAIAARTAQARVAAAQGRTVEAGRLADEAVSLADATDLTMDHANAVAGLALVRSTAGDSRGAAAAERQARDLFEAKGAVVQERAVATSPVEPAATTAHLFDTPATRTVRAATPDVDIVAVRGDRLCLVGSGDAMSVVEVDPAGAEIERVPFARSELAEALAEINHRFQSDLPPTHAAVVDLVRWHTLQIDEGPEALTATMTDDFALIDRDILFTGPRDRESWVANLTGSDQGVDAFGSAFLRSIDRVNDRGLIGVCSATTADASGDSPDAEWRFVLIQVVRDGKIARTELHPEQDYAAALDRFEALTVHHREDAEVVDVARELWRRLFDDLDVEAAMALVDGGGLDDNRATMQLPLDRAQTGELLRASIEGVTYVDHSVDVLALRGPVLLTRVRARYHPAGVEREILAVTRLVHGQLADNQIFDSFAEGYRAMQELHRQHDGAAFADTLDLVSAFMDRMDEGASTTIDPPSHPNARMLDHRAGQAAELVLTDVGREYQAQGMHGRTTITRFHRLDERGAVCEAIGEYADADGFETESRFAQVFLVEDGLISRWEVFDANAVDDACARFDELIDGTNEEHQLENAATRLTHRSFTALFDDLDVDATLALTHPTARLIDHRHMRPLPTGDQAELRAFLEATLKGVDRVEWRCETIAIRGERLALSLVKARYLPAQAERELLYLARVEDGLVIAEMFDPEDLSGALATLADRWLDAEGAPYREIIDASAAIAQAFQGPTEKQRALLENLVHPGAVFLDHRPSSYPELDIDSATGANLSTVTDGGVFVTVEHLAINDLGFLCRQENRIYSDRWGEQRGYALTLVVFDEGRMRRMEWFNWDQEALARERFAELTSTSPGLHQFETDEVGTAIAALDKPTTEPLTRLENRASKAADRLFAIMTGRSDETWDEVRHPAAEVRDRRLIHNRERSGSDHSAAISESMDYAAMRAIDSATIATRGENHCLFHYRYRPAGEQWELGGLSVIEVDNDGRVTREGLFDQDARDEAFSLLERWSFEKLSQEQRDVLAALQRMVANQRDRAALDEIFAPEADFTFIDHDVWLFDGFTREQAIEGHASWAETSGEVEGDLVHVPRLTGDGVLIANNPRSVTRGIEWSLCTIYRFNNAGQITHIEYFPFDQLAEAIDRFDELATTAAEDPLENMASRAIRAVTEATCRDRDLEATLALLHDDFAASDRRGGTTGDVTKAGWGSALARSYAADAAEGWSLTTLAIRSERFALACFASKDRDVLICAEIDDAGLHRRAAWFGPDQREDADATLADWWIGSLDQGAADTLVHLGALGAASGDRDALDQRFAPDMTFKDHDVWLFDGFTREQVIEGFVSMADAIGRATHEYTAIPRINEQGILTAERQAAVDESVEWWYCTIHLRNPDGTVAHIEYFPYDQLGVAVERFDELTESPPKDHIDPANSYRNRCQRVVEEFNDMLRTGDLVGIERLSHPESVSISPRDGVTMDGEELMDSFRVMHGGEFGDVDLDVEWIATRGETFSVAKQTYTTADRGLLAVRYIVRELADDGRLIRGLTLPEDGLDEAVATLVDWFNATLDDEQRAVIDTARKSADASSLPDVLAPDFVATDLRAVPFPPLNREEFIAGYVDGDGEPVSGVDFFPHHVPRLTRHGMVIVGRASGGDEDEGTVTFEVDAVGLINAIQYEEVADVDRAVARFDAAEAVRTAEPTNLATRIVRRFAELVNSGRIREIAKTYAPDSRNNDHRRQAGLGLDAPVDTFVHALEARTEWGDTLEVETLETHGERYGLFSFRFASANGFESPGYWVCRTNADGLQEYGGLWDDLEDARADLQRLLSEGHDDAAPANTAARITIAEIRAMYVDKVLPPFDPAITTDDRSGIRSLDMNDEATLQSWFDEFVAPFDIEVGETVLAVEGDDLALIRYTLDVSGSPFPVEYLSLTRTDEERIRETVLFDAADGEAARAELAAMAHAPTRAAREFWRLVYTDRDVEAALALGVDDAVSIDRRRLVASPDLTKIGVREFLAVIARSGTDPVDYELTVVGQASQRVLIRLRAREPNGEWGQDLLQVLTLNDDGLIASASSFSPEDVEQATAELR
ncbi:MAG: adenylate/guanylate cyclase domain-containing protein [Actinomycetota bacterium]